MADFTRLNGYDVKDKIAREDLEKIKDAIAPATLDDISLATTISSLSSDNEIVTAKAVYDYIQDLLVTKYSLVFNVTPSDATIVLKDSNNVEINPATNNTYLVPNGVYTYTITKEGYVTITDTVIVNDSDVSLTINMVTLEHTLSFNVTPSGATILVKDSNDNVINPDINNNYIVVNGTYTYTITKEGYITVENTVTINDADVTLTITMELATFDLSFNVNPYRCTIEVTDSNSNPVLKDENDNYPVLNGTYNYTITADGYTTITDSVTINNADVSLNITMTSDNSLFSKLLTAHNGINEIEERTTPDFSQTSNTDDGMFYAPDNLGYSYYFRGAVEDNYVSFASKTWRIIRVNGDNTVRMITNDVPLTNKAFDTSSNNQVYVGYKNGSGLHGLDYNSNAKTELETWYNNNLNSYDNYIADQLYVNDRLAYTDTTGTTSATGNESTIYFASYIRNQTNKQPLLATDVVADRFAVGSSIGDIETNASCSKKIGLLTLDEYCLAGNKIGSNDYTYLRNTTNWWLGTPSDYSSGRAKVYSASRNGASSGRCDETSSIGESIGLRPVISLKSTVKVASGTGTLSDPYVLTL